ncbi:MAG TPA: pilus assembly protein N-terminal domain-containing protein [Silvibacterium sp.]|nr:pilus assembly protein N-terminal domain-containing protein [Silvibacterium sp.]
MKVRSLIPFVSFCALSIAVCTGPTLSAQDTQPTAPRQETSRELSVAVGKTALIDFSHPVTRVALGVGDIAEVSAVSPTEVLVNGKAPGTTSLIVWERGGERQFFNVSVHNSRFTTDDSLTMVRRELHLQFPGQDISATDENGVIYLRGTAKDLGSSERAVQVASNMGKVVNLLYVAVPQSPPQILLKVRFCSVDRSMEKQLGLNIFSTGAANTIGSVNTGQFSPPSVSTPSTGGAVATINNALNISVFRPDLNLGATIEALETKGVVESLAEPNLLAEDGKQASFLAGGEFPYPVVQATAGGAGGAVTILFKEFGIRLNFIPTITPRGTIRLQLAPEVSALDFANAIQVSGFNVPAISVRRVKTEVELENNQSFVIGGLLDNTESQTFDKIPFLGDIPVLGKFFQSMTRSKGNTELIVIVTPEEVPPIPAGQALPALHYPEAFMAPNSNVPMSNPTGSPSASPQPTAVPVEQLIESNKPEKPLVIEGGMGTSTN